MTTIATDGKSIAGDGRATLNDTITSDNAIKVFRLPGNKAVGVAGCAAKGKAIVDAMIRGEDVTGQDFTDVCLVVIDGTSSVTVYEGGKLIMPTPYARGTGIDVAYGALDAGMSPTQAVRIATKRDIYSGGKVRTITLK